MGEDRLVKLEAFQSIFSFTREGDDVIGEHYELFKTDLDQITDHIYELLREQKGSWTLEYLVNILKVYQDNQKINGIVRSILDIDNKRTPIIAT